MHIMHTLPAWPSFKRRPFLRCEPPRVCICIPWYSLEQGLYWYGHIKAAAAAAAAVAEPAAGPRGRVLHFPYLFPIAGSFRPTRVTESGLVFLVRLGGVLDFSLAL